ncbi:hypothetical protein QWY85_17030 [Neolewinella lacunae]|uniref:Uncharacterized protein n=1 Tax=Neolewinella lacunae TaxID=1517758 RepID=A0A923PGJ7_9BACT|nr:hypothetical protein [Neolewinella lacunae]MBC6993677.1 hypothetical protein [Neolewinella lacunae]MDN3636372.1 hypothetical protein [Neolewinella lacunae]
MRPTHAAYSLVLLLLLTSCSDGSRSEEMLLAKPPIEDTVAKEEMTIQEEKLKHQVRLQAPELVPEENPFLNAKVPQVTDGKHSFTNFVLDYSDASQKKALLESIKMVVAKEDYPADGSKIYSWVYVADAIDYIYDKRTYSAYTQRVFAAVGLNNPVLSEAEDIVYLGGKSAIPCYSNKGEIGRFCNA